MNDPLRPAMTAPGGLDRPDKRTLARWTMWVLAAHLGLLAVIAGTLEWRLPSAEPIRTAPIQTRWIPPAPQTAKARALAPAPSAPAKTRVAQVTASPTPAASAQPATAETSAIVPAEEVSTASPTTAMPQAPAASTPPVAMADPNESDLPPPPALLTSADQTGSSPAAVEPSNATRAPQDAQPTTPALIANANTALPSVSLAALPPSAVLSYRLNGQEKGIQYTASGELRWQHNDTAYEMSLSIKAFLLGTRLWRSLGDITSAGLAPTKFSDSWRSERAAHFDRRNQRIVFSSNAPTALLLPGAQDQISLYAQLAAAMAGSAQQLKPGTRLQIQTATVRDAVPWLLTLDEIETLSIEGKSVQATKWVCQPRNRFDAKVEFWLTAEQAWLPSRIRITQVSGNFIDLSLNGQSPLPPLPPKPPLD